MPPTFGTLALTPVLRVQTVAPAVACPWKAVHAGWAPEMGTRLAHSLGLKQKQEEEEETLHFALQLVMVPRMHAKSNVAEVPALSALWLAHERS